MKTIILPKRNLQDLEEVPEDVRKEMKFIPVESVEEVFDYVFKPAVRGASTPLPPPQEERYISPASDTAA